MSRVLVFEDGQLRAEHDPLPPFGSVTVADSFLYLKQRLRVASFHRERFTQSVRAHTPHLLEQLDAFWHAAVEEMRDEPEANVRFDVFDDRLWLRVRPVPELGLTREAVTSSAKLHDARTKGPNIQEYHRLNERNDAETLVVDADGALVEGATTSVVWWPNAQPDTLCHVASTERVTGTTERFVREFALSSGSRVEPVVAQPRQLLDAEVWLVNALHGLRVLTTLDGLACADPDHERLALFRRAFDDTWQPLISDRDG